MTLLRSPRARLGAAFLVLGLLVNPWTLGRLATEDGSIGDIDKYAVVLAFTTVCLLGGLQLLLRWIEPLAWGKRVGFVRGAAVVGVAALVTAGTYWVSATYQRGHHHTELVENQQHTPTLEQMLWADDFYQRSLAAARRHGWFDIKNALAQGFQPDPINRTHFPNQKNMFDDVILDPDRPEWLVYDDSPDGKVLMALMFFTREVNEVGPTPGGPLAQWHFHPYDKPRCAIKGLWTVAKTDKYGKCAVGIPVMRTPEMLHVWFIDHPLGRYTEMKIVPEFWQEGFDIKRVHPAIVHFAIALFLMAVFLDLFALATARPQLHRVAWVNLVLAAIAIAAAVAYGLMAEVALAPTHEAHQTLDVHRRLGFLSLAGVLLLLAWRHLLRGDFPRRGVVLYIVLSLAGAGAIGGAGYFGGEMVFTHGAAVRAIDRFSRDQYWRRVREVYRKPAVGVGLE